MCKGFEEIGNLPNCLLAIDGTEIQISKPSSRPFSYYNRHDVFSITFLCAVDYKMRFRAISYGYGSSHDSYLYRISNLRNLIEDIDDPHIFIVGDPAFRGFERIRTAISTNNEPLTPFLESSLSKQRIKVENAFGLFKGKFKRFNGRVLKGGEEKNIDYIKCAFFIHNWIINNQ